MWSLILPWTWLNLFMEEMRWEHPSATMRQARKNGTRLDHRQQHPSQAPFFLQELDWQLVPDALRHPPL